MSKGILLGQYKNIIYKQSIRHLDKPLCTGCVYLVYNNSYPEISKCMRFANKNLVDGKIEYTFADSNRKEYGMCGVDAKYKRVLPTVDV